VIAIRLLADGATVREEVFREPSLVIGRGPESDFVIVDASVSRRHACIRTDEAGQVWIEDAGSRNGLRTEAGRVDRAAVPAGGALRCWLGAAEVELALAEADATLEIAAPTHAEGTGRLRSAAFWAAGIAAWGGLMLLQASFWSPWQQDRLTRVSWLILGAAVALPVLAFVLVGLLRIAGRRARVRDALRGLALVSWGWVLLALLDAALSYVLGVGAHGVLSLLLLNAGVAVSVAYLASVGRRGGHSGRFFAAWAAVVAVLLAGFNAAGRLAAQQAGVPQLDYELNMPIAGVTGPAHPLDGYLEGVRAAFAIAERRAAEDRRSSQAAR
jgi:FHA domain-containing protein